MANNNKTNHDPIRYITKNSNEDDQLGKSQSWPIYGRKRAIIAFIIIPIVAIFILRIISHSEDTHQVMGIFGLATMSAVIILFSLSILFYAYDLLPFIKNLLKEFSVF